ncbi:hypothetical protein HDU96_000374 [Phlyctochytrium bullatum]|nr:hypothetical protein HDU96_000374 [Phlyctochytrium bullatum]
MSVVLNNTGHINVGNVSSSVVSPPPNAAPSQGEFIEWRGTIDPNEIKIQKNIATNLNCTIEKGVHRNIAVIVKRSTNKDLIEREIEFLGRASTNEFIVTFRGWFEETGGIMGLVMQKCAFDLKGWSKQASKSADLEPKKLQISMGIAKGLAHINSLNIIHNDLKPENVFVDEFNKPFIGDFGVATSPDEKLLGYTERYFDKESLAPNPFDSIPDELSDSWLLGATLWEFWTNDLFNVNEKIHLEDIPNDVIRSIVGKLLRVRDRRPTANGILTLFNSSTVRTKYITVVNSSNRLSPRPVSPVPPNAMLLAPNPFLGLVSSPPMERSLSALSASSAVRPAENFPTDLSQQYWNALTAGQTGPLQTLLSSKQIQVESTMDGLTGLQLACRQNYADVVRLLLEFEADHEKKDGDGKLPIQLSTSVDVWRVLSSKMPAPEIDLFEAAEIGDDVGTRLILAAEKDPKTKLRIKKRMPFLHFKRHVAPIHVAAFHGHAAVCEIFLDAGTEINVVDDGKWTPLVFAAHAGHVDVVSLLLERGADIDSRDVVNNTALSYAAANGRLETVRFLVDKGADVESRNQFEQTPFQRAANGGHVDVTLFLLQNGGDVDSRDNYRQTSLHRAATFGKLEMARLLIDNGADIQSRDKNSNTPLHCAAHSGHVAVMELLIEKGVGIEAKGDMDQTPLHMAATANKMEAALFLLEKGANVNAKDNLGYSPLFRAVTQGHKEITELLTGYGAETNLDINSMAGPNNEIFTQMLNNIGQFYGRESTSMEEEPEERPAPAPRKKGLFSFFKNR